MDEVADIRQSALALLGDLARVCSVTIFLLLSFSPDSQASGAKFIIQAKFCVNCPQMTEANLKPESESNSSITYQFGVLDIPDYSLRGWHQIYWMLFVVSHSKRLVQCICDVPFSLNAYS
jgi:hypothetical protein